MSFRVNTNLASLSAQTSLGKVTRESHESSIKLSTGEKINKAADDAAGLAISEKMKAEIRSSRQANRNANDGISLVQVAEGGLHETSSILTRMRELAIQAASDTLDDSARSMSNIEYQGLKDELDRIALSTDYNGTKLLDGSASRIDFQVGTGADSADDRVYFMPSQLNATTVSLGVKPLSIASKGGAQSSLASLDGAINKVSNQRSILGSIQNRLASSSNNLGIYTQNMSEANSRIRDTDYSVESAKHSRNLIISDASTAVLAQANVSGNGALKLL